MDPRHLKLYNEELHFIREMGKIFARNHRKIAGHLDLGRGDCQDPYVERLLEGFAFLTSRIQLQYEEDFPEFSQHLLNIIYPDFLSPLPSMTIIRFKPDDELQADGFPLPKGARMLSPRISEKKVQCEYRTTQDLHLWPIVIDHASYLVSGSLSKEIRQSLHPDRWQKTRAAIKITLKTTRSNTPFKTLTTLDELPFYLSSNGDITGKIYEILLRNLHQIVITSSDKKTITLLEANALQPLGFDNAASLLPTAPQTFQGYRLLQEYFALAERFFFVALTQLQDALCQFDTQQLDIYFLLDAIDENLKTTLNTSHFELFCTPAINLFEKTSDAVHLTKQPAKKPQKNEITHYLPGHPIIIDKSNPQYFEVYKIQQVKGVTGYTQKAPVFQPFYSLNHSSLDRDKHYFYTLKRKVEMRESNAISHHYKGNDLYISIHDDSSPFPHDSTIKELRIKALCTNRGLPLYLGNTTINFTSPESLPVKAIGGIQNIIPFSTPKPSHLTGEHTWKLINLLSLNHLSIADDNNTEQNTQALKELLQLQLHTQQVNNSVQALHATQQQISQGIQQVQTQSIVHPLLIQGRMTYARGIEVTITLKEAAFAGSSAFLFGSVLNHFFTQYISINSFSQTVIETLERGEIMRWPIKAGTQKVL